MKSCHMRMGSILYAAGHVKEGGVMRRVLRSCERELSGYDVTRVEREMREVERETCNCVKG